MTIQHSTLSSESTTMVPFKAVRLAMRRVQKTKRLQMWVRCIMRQSACQLT